MYHVETDFVMGEVEEVDNKNQTTNSWIWPTCLPKNDEDPEFQSDKGMIAGWLDAPPIDQTFSRILGSAVSEGDVFK